MKKYLIILVISLFAAGCSLKKEQLLETTEFTFVNSTDTRLRYKDRLVFYDTILFSGRIAELSNGDTVSLSEYKSGKLNGKQVTYFKKGKVNEERYYENGLKTGEHKGWWENGNMRFIYHFIDDMFDGNVKVWNEKGMLFNNFNYVKGQEEGLQQAWFPSGDLQANYVVKNNRKYGITGVKNCQTVSGDLTSK
ncbi:MAG: hypothetical protein ABI543_12690 [Ignavibacteria bacterium]